MLPDLSKLFPLENAKKPVILIVDDEKDFIELFGNYVKLLNGDAITTQNVEDAQKILENLRFDKSIMLVIVDLKYPVGSGNDTPGQGNEVSRGVEIVRYVKVEHPEVACLMISGKTVSPSDVLDMRDQYGLDYFLAKDNLSLTNFANAIISAKKRVEVVQNEYDSVSKYANRISSRSLREFIDVHFNMDELKDLCFYMEIDYELLEGATINSKSRELISYVKRHGKYYELIRQCQKSRPRPFKTKFLIS